MRRLAFISLFFLALLAAVESYAESNDFFSNTASTNARFKDANLNGTDDGDDCVGCPGFNPCNNENSGSSCSGNGLLRGVSSGADPVCAPTAANLRIGTVGGTLCAHAGPDGLTSPGADGIHGTLDDDNLVISPLFATTGPGAITDNMFGAVADPTRTTGAAGFATCTAAGSPSTTCAFFNVGIAEADTASANFGKGPRPPSKCGNISLAGNFGTDTPGGAIVIDPGFKTGLNCAYLRFDPTTQGMTIPTFGDNGGPNGLTARMLSETTMVGLRSGFLQTTSATSCVNPGNVTGETPGTRCDVADFSKAATKFLAGTGAGQSGDLDIITKVGLFNSFDWRPDNPSNTTLCADGAATPCTKVVQTLVQETSTENGIARVERGFKWVTTHASGGANNGLPNHDGVATTDLVATQNCDRTAAAATTDLTALPASANGRVCVHWWVFNQDPVVTKGSGYGINDATEGFFIYNNTNDPGTGVAPVSTSSPTGASLTFGIFQSTGNPNGVSP